MITNKHTYRNPTMVNNKSLLFNFSVDGNGTVLRLFDIKVGYLKRRYRIDTTRPLITIDEFFQILSQIQAGKILAEEAVGVAPEIMLQPGGVLVPHIAAATFAQMAPRQTTQYIPPAYQELYNICSKPEAVDRTVILRIANKMGYEDANLLFPLSNTEICRTLMNFAQVQLAGRAPV